MATQDTDGVQDWFAGRTAVIATMHGKEVVIAPRLVEALKVKTYVPSDFDTDQFGTFTGEVKRVGDQLEAARAKARAALTLTGHDLVIASEGSVAPHPQLPLISSNLELVVLIDTKHNLEIVGSHRSGSVTIETATVRSSAEALMWAHEQGFPEQGVILRPRRGSSAIQKELRTEAALTSAVEQLMSRPWRRSVYLETDLRAHRCPGRLETIATATEDLITKCKSHCPQCLAPGFVGKDVIRGLPCGACGRATDSLRAHRYHCASCDHTQVQPVEATSADPGQCEWCNP